MSVTSLNKLDDSNNIDYCKKYIPALFLTFVFRILISCIKPYPIDMYGYLAWSKYLAIYGPSQFYGSSGFHVVYAPFFSIFMAYRRDCKQIFCLYCITCLPDKIMVGFIWIYRSMAYSVNRWKIKKAKSGTIMALIYLVNPGVYINSSIWGQFDSIPATMLIGVIALFEYKKHNLAALLFLIAVLTKPQSGLLLPVVLYLYFKDIRMD